VGLVDRHGDSDGGDDDEEYAKEEEASEDGFSRGVSVEYERNGTRNGIGHTCTKEAELVVKRGSKGP
jgi:hypothetical protein